MAAVVDQITKPVLGFKPMGVPVGPAVVGALVAGAGVGLLGLVQGALPVKPKSVQGQRAMNAAGLGLAAWAVVQFKPVKNIVGDAGIPAALFLGLMAASQLAGALRPDKPVPNVITGATNWVLGALGGAVALGSGNGKGNGNKSRADAPTGNYTGA